MISSRFNTHAVAINYRHGSSLHWNYAAKVFEEIVCQDVRGESAYFPQLATGQHLGDWHEICKATLEVSVVLRTRTCAGNQSWKLAARIFRPFLQHHACAQMLVSYNYEYTAACTIFASAEHRV